MPLLSSRGRGWLLAGIFALTVFALTLALTLTSAVADLLPAGLALALLSALTRSLSLLPARLLALPLLFAL